jgi:hypothetical protein
MAMNVQPAAARADVVQAVARVARVAHVSLADLLAGAGGDAAERQALARLLRERGNLAARVIETRADGATLLALGNTRVALRLQTRPAPGDTLLIGLDDTAAADTRSAGARAGEPAPAAHQKQNTVLNQYVMIRSSANAALAPGLLAAAGDEPATSASSTAAVSLSRSASFLNDIQKIVLNHIVTDDLAALPELGDTDSPQALARELQQAVRSSGLFYESHLRGWVEGSVALKHLHDEPQARVAPLPHGGEPREVVHPQLEPLVRQQLDTLEQQRIVWHGRLGPDQQAGLVITGEPQPADAQTPRAWRVQLALDTPALGKVTADIALSGRRLSVQVNGEDTSLRALREGRAALERALAAHDLDVHPIPVRSATP